MMAGSFRYMFVSFAPSFLTQFALRFFFLEPFWNAIFPTTGKVAACGESELVDRRRTTAVLQKLAGRMGTTQSGAAAGEGGVGGDAAPEQPPTMESMMKALDGDPEVERQRVISLLGLDVGEGKDEVIWLDKSLGLQSRCFLVRGERWKGRGKQPVVDPTAAAGGTAFVKALPTWSVEETAKRQRLEAKEKAEAEARASGATEEEAIARGEQASEKATVVEWAEPSKQLAREREVLRAWQAAEEAGDLQLPDDTFLVIPQLLDNVVQDEEAKKLEEEKPSFLVFEDLVAAGFVPQSHLQAITVEDGIAVSRALADLHAALWRIRARLFKEEDRKVDKESPTTDKGKGTFVDEAAKIKATYESLLCGAVEQVRRNGPLGKVAAERFEPVVEKVSGAFVAAGVEPILICHGDAWVHNVMLRRDRETGSVNGVAFVDLGNVRKMNPLVDFFSFLGTMMKGLELWSKEKPVQAEYEARLRKQIPETTLSENTELFSVHARRHAYARMLQFFLNVHFWMVKGASSDGEPAHRLVNALAMNRQLHQHQEIAPDPLVSSAGTDEGLRKRK